MDPTAKKLIEEAREAFQRPYWQKVLDVMPPPQAVLIQVKYNGQVSTYNHDCYEDTQPLLTITSDGKLEFVTSRGNNIQPQLNQLFIRLVFEQFMKPTKNIIISAERTRVIHIDNSHNVDTQEVQSISPDMLASSDYSFTIPEEDKVDNCRLCTYSTDPKSPVYCLEYDNGGVKIGTQQFRYNLENIGQIPTSS